MREEIYRVGTFRSPVIVHVLDIISLQMGRVKLLQFTILSGKEQGPKLKALVYEFESALPSKNIANGNQVKSYRIYFFIYLFIYLFLRNSQF